VDRGLLARRKGITEKKMFGGLAFMLHGKMFCGVLKDDLVVRVEPEGYEKALSRAHARPMDFTGRPLKGYVFVGSSGLRTDKMLGKWIEEGVEFASSLRQK
jgi:TfoX/Sxy family transcriptional regulator of competence genes